jgi:hypothetical protein
MPLLSRRAFLGWLAAALPASALVRRAHAFAIDDLAGNARTLHAIAEAVLPSELASASVTIVSRFQRWIAGYRENSELLHGYGTSTLEHAGPTPATRWAAQLAQLEAKGFADFSLERRREILRSELSSLKIQRLGTVGRAPHVAVALLAHFYASPEANDLCYGASIGKQTCRPLATSSRKPLPIAKAHA